MKLWTIRDAQLHLLTEDARRRDLLTVREHARRFFTALLAEVPDEKLDRALARMVAEAGRRGLTARKDVLLFVNLSLAYGEAFWERRELAWANDLLEDRAVGSPAERLRNLYAEAARRGGEERP